jgi:hypothetical protein
MNTNTQTLGEIWRSIDTALRKPYDKNEFERIYTQIDNTSLRILKKSVFKVTKNSVNKGEINLLELVKLITSDYYEDVLKSDSFKRYELVRIGDLLETKYKRNRNINGLTRSVRNLRLGGRRQNKTKRRSLR